MTPSLEVVVEALLFVAEGPVEIARLERATGSNRDAVETTLIELARRYADRGVRLQRSGESVALVSAPEAAELVSRFLGLEGSTHLSAAALETLAIVAYRQPVTRSEIEAIRGVNADHAIRVLHARGVIAEAGRRESVGRPALFATTFEFLQYFGLASLAELPALPEDFAAFADERQGTAPVERATPIVVE